MRTMRISTRGPMDENGRLINLRGRDMRALDFESMEIDREATRRLHRCIEEYHFIQNRAKYGKGVKRLPVELIEKRALANFGEITPVDDGTWIVETPEEQAEKYGVDPAKLQRMQTRALDPGADSAFQSIDYLDQILMELRLAGQLEKEFPNQRELAPGRTSWTGTILQAAQYVGQGPVLTDTYSVPVAIDPSSEVITMTPKKHMAGIFFTTEMDEDSFMPVVPGLEECLRQGAAIAKEHTLISGDTTAGTGNINCYNHDADSTGLGEKDVRLTIDGLRNIDYRSSVFKSANTFSGVNIGNAVPDVADFVNNRIALDKYGAMADRVIHIAPVHVRDKLLLDVNATPLSTIPIVQGNDGLITHVGGSRVIGVGNSTMTSASSAEIPTYSGQLSEGYPTNLNAAGLYDAVTTNRTGFLTVNKDGIMFLWRRQLQLVVVKLPIADQSCIVGTYRWTFRQTIPGYGVACAFNGALS